MFNCSNADQYFSSSFHYATMRLMTDPCQGLALLPFCDINQECVYTLIETVRLSRLSEVCNMTVLQAMQHHGTCPLQTLSNGRISLACRQTHLRRRRPARLSTVAAAINSDVRASPGASTGPSCCLLSISLGAGSYLLTWTAPPTFCGRSSAIATSANLQLCSRML